MFKGYQQHNPINYGKKEIVLKTSILSFGFMLTVKKKSAVQLSKKAYLQKISTIFNEEMEISCIMTALMFGVKFVQFATYILCNCPCLQV